MFDSEIVKRNGQRKMPYPDEYDFAYAAHIRPLSSTPLTSLDFAPIKVEDVDSTAMIAHETPYNPLRGFIGTRKGVKNRFRLARSRFASHVNYPNPSDTG
jgi:hypothetical protein